MLESGMENEPTTGATPVLMSRAEAKALGLKHFYTGVPCIRGHLSGRFISVGTCISCVYEANKARRLANPEKHKEKADAYVRANYAKQLAASKKWRDNNKEQEKERHIKYNAENKEKIKLWGTLYYEKNKARILARTKGREKHVIQATPKWADSDLIWAVYIEAAKLTKITGLLHHVDHVIPLRGKLVCGLHVHNNLQAIPASKNWAKYNSFNPDLDNI